MQYWLIAGRVGGGVSGWGFPIRMKCIAMDRAAGERTEQVSCMGGGGGFKEG